MGFLLVLGIVGGTVLSVVLRGYVLSVLWAWFMVPTFGLPEIGIAQAIGISLIIGFLTHQEIDESGVNNSTRIVASIIRSVAALGLGWIILQFM